MKPVQPDDTLSAVVGNKAMPRTEVTKKLWAYIKKNRLQGEKKKTNINADDKLLIASFFTAVVGDLLAPLGTTVNLGFAATAPYVVVIVLGRRLLRRKNL